MLGLDALFALLSLFEDENPDPELPPGSPPTRTMRCHLYDLTARS
jgi:hypothetical protein